MKNMEVRVLKLINIAPNKSWSQLFFWRGDLTRGAWQYWTKVLVDKGWARAIYHPRGETSWYGYVITDLGLKTLALYDVAEIPF